jgi:hypothetical protein
MGPLDDLDQENVLTDDNAITNKKSAESSLAGIYTTWKTFNMTSFRDLMFVRSGELADVNMGGVAEFRANAVQSDNLQMQNVYSGLYYVIACANSFINNLNKTTLTDITAETKADMIGQAYFNKALAETYLLRLFGEFYDMDSKYGIVLWDTPIRNNVPKARASVAESYTHIMDCLDKAAVTGENNYHANAKAVKALKARVLISMKKYGEASAMADEVMGAAALENDYLSCFSNYLTSGEVLFTLLCKYPGQLYGITALTYYNKPGTVLSGLSANILAGNVDGRYTKVFDAEAQAGPYGNNKYVYSESSTEMTNSNYFIRLAEVILIKAEAECRQKHYDAARQTLKMVTDRAGYDADYVNTIADDNLLVKIMEHKYMELFLENYETWFDMVRLYKLDGKVLGTSANLAPGKTLILPIPRAAMSGNNLLIGNP